MTQAGLALPETAPAQALLVATAGEASGSDGVNSITHLPASRSGRSHAQRSKDITPGSAEQVGATAQVSATPKDLREAASVSSITLTSASAPQTGTSIDTTLKTIALTAAGEQIPRGRQTAATQRAEGQVQIARSECGAPSGQADSQPPDAPPLLTTQGSADSGSTPEQSASSNSQPASSGSPYIASISISSFAATAAADVVVPTGYSAVSLPFAMEPNPASGNPERAPIEQESALAARHGSRVHDDKLQDSSPQAAQPDAQSLGKSPTRQFSFGTATAPAPSQESGVASAASMDFSQSAASRRAANAEHLAAGTGSPAEFVPRNGEAVPGRADSVMPLGTPDANGPDASLGRVGATGSIPTDGFAFGARLVPVDASRDLTVSRAPTPSASASADSQAPSAQAGGADDSSRTSAAAENSKSSADPDSGDDAPRQPSSAASAARPGRGNSADPEQSTPAVADRTVISATSTTGAGDPGAAGREPVSNTVHTDGASEAARVPTETLAEAPASRAPARDLAFELGGGEQRVTVRIADRGGEIHLSVRTPDADLAGDLRRELPTLASRLEQSGLRPQGWQAGESWRHTQQPAGTGLAQEGQQHGRPDSRDRRESQARHPDAGKKSDIKKEGKEFAWFLSSLG